MKKQILSEQFLRMSKLAGLLTENELTEISSDKFKKATDIKTYITKIKDFIDDENQSDDDDNNTKGDKKASYV